MSSYSNTYNIVPAICQLYSPECVEQLLIDRVNFIMIFAVLQHLRVQQLFRIQFSFNFISISISMACPVLIADVRVLAGEGPPVLTSPTIQLGMWTAAFSAMASFLSALGLGEIEASSLAAWLHEAVGMGTILLGGHRNGDHLLLREVSHPVLASVALTDRLQDLQHLDRVFDCAIA